MLASLFSYHVDQFMKECIFSVYFCGDYFKLASVLIYQKISVHKYGILCCCKCGVQSNWASALTQHQIIVL